MRGLSHVDVHSVYLQRTTILFDGIFPVKMQRNPRDSGFGAADITTVFPMITVMSRLNAQSKFHLSDTVFFVVFSSEGFD